MFSLKPTKQFRLTYFTIRNSSCGKVLFSQASVILSTRGVYTPPAKHTPLGRHPRQADTPLPQTATAADRAHPTGMHSFFLCHLTLFFHLPSSADSIELVNI